MNTLLARMIGSAFGEPDASPACAVNAVSPAPTFSYHRKKLWELPSRWHCPLVGTCLPVADMRKLAARAGLDADAMNDYTLHVALVGSCGSRSAITDALQRFLDKRYALALARFGAVKDESDILALWREALASGDDVAGALWAAWCHPGLTDDGAASIYGDIHMLSHQVGAAARADLRRLVHLKQDNQRLQSEAQALRRGLAEVERQWGGSVAKMERELKDAEARAALLERRELELAEARRQARNYTTLAERSAAMSRRIETLEERNAANARRANALELALGEAHASLAATEAALESALGVCDGVAGSAGCGRACPAEAALAGRCVLCVGGRTRLVAGYRQLVEIQGGRFLHHDGGQEESPHRIDGFVSGADAVICQSGCVSHAAYQRIKEACKKLGKPCVFVPSPGVGSFARSLAALTGEGTAQTRCGRLAG